MIANVVFSTSWDLLTSPLNRGVAETLETIIRLVGIAHQTPLLWGSKYAAIISLPHLAWSSRSLRKYTIAMIKRSRALRATDPTIDDYYGQFSSAVDPDTGGPALTRVNVRINSANFIIAGMCLSLSNS